MTVAGANFQKVERNGNIISPAGSNQARGPQVEELSRAEIEEADLDPETDLVVEELEGGNARIRERKGDEHVVKVDTDSLANSRLSRFFTEEELSTLRDKAEIVEGKEGPSSYDEAMEGIRKDVERHNKQVAKKRRQMEIEQAKEELKKGTKYDPNRSVSDLSGEEFKEIIAEANQEGNSESESEELEAAIDQINQKYAPMLGEDSEPEINDPSVEIDELDKGLEAWRERAEEKSYWGHFAEDLEESDDQTTYESVGPNSVRVTTQEEELVQALRNHEKEPFDGSVELEQDTGETVIAVVSKED